MAKSIAQLAEETSKILGVSPLTTSSILNHFFEDLENYRKYPTHPIYRIRYFGSFQITPSSLRRCVKMLIRKLRKYPTEEAKQQLRHLLKLRHKVYEYHQDFGK